MEKMPKSTGKGAFMRKIWEELKQAGHPAMSMTDIENFIKGGDEMLTRKEVEERIFQYFRRKLQTVIDEDTGEQITIWRSAPMKGELAAALGIDETTLCRYVGGKYNGRTYIDGGTRGCINPKDFDLVRKAYQIIRVCQVFCVSFKKKFMGRGTSPYASPVTLLNYCAKVPWSNRLLYGTFTADF